MTGRGVLGAALGAVGFAVCANAADLPVPMLVKAPVMPVVAPWNWTGFYIGGNIGGALTTSRLEDPFGQSIWGDNFRSPGFMAGGQAGANYQLGRVVIGAVADLDWDNSKGDLTCFNFSFRFLSSNCSVHPDAFGTLAGRVGYAFGNTLVYAKAGAAWERNNVDMFVNRNPAGLLVTSSNRYGEWGWTAGGGIEYAMTPAWSLTLEYDFLDFGNHSVATPYQVGNSLPGSPIGPAASLSDVVQQVKLGVNYRFGADPRISPPGWPAPAAYSWMPLKVPSFVASGWEITGGARDMFSWGREQWDLGNTNRTVANSLTSRLTWNNLQSNSVELFGRVDTPWNIFASGFIGAGETFSGAQNDEDFHLLGGTARNYQNTASTNVGNVNYAVFDLGYDIFRRPDYKLGAFLGYSYFKQILIKSGCVQVADPLANCTNPGPNEPTNVIGLENIIYNSLRVGVSAEATLYDRIKLSTDVAYLPIAQMNWDDQHSLTLRMWNMSGYGDGVQAQAVLSYDLTDRLSVGIGGRYWAMWTTTAASPSHGQQTNNSVELAGAFVQTSYRFAPGDPFVGAVASAAPFYRAPPLTPPSGWTGFYVGAEGGGVWGQSKQVAMVASGLNAGNTFDVEPFYGLRGGIAGGTVGYNSQFAGIWLFGFEGDASWTDASGGSNEAPPFNPKATNTTSEHWLVTTRARLGVTPLPGWLFYTTAGLAGAAVEADIITPANNTFAQTKDRWGWTAGGGVEVAINRDWSVKVEYLYLGLENVPYFSPTSITGLDKRVGGVPTENQIVRAGINYRFDWATLAYLVK